MGAETDVPEVDKKFVDALKESIRQHRSITLFGSHMKRKLGEDREKWRRFLSAYDHRGPLSDIVDRHIKRNGEVIISDGELKDLFRDYQSNGANLLFLKKFVGFLRENRQDALELKNSL